MEKMLGKRHIVFVLIVVLASSQIFMIQRSGLENALGENAIRNVRPSGSSGSYVSHAPINITCDQDLIDQGWPGSGTPADPYVIEGLNITDDNSGIWVKNITKRLIIRNCLIRVTGTKLYPNEFNGTDFLILDNNIFMGNLIIVRIIDADNVTIQGNKFYEISCSSTELFIISSIDFNVKQNYFERENAFGFQCYLCAGVLENNTFHRNLQLPYIPFSIDANIDTSEVIVRGNKFLVSYMAIQVQDAITGIMGKNIGLRIEDNYIETGAFAMYCFRCNGTVRNNTIIGYRTAIVFLDSENVAIQNNHMDCENGIAVLGSTNFIIKDNSMTISYSGIMLTTTSDSVANNNDIVFRKHMYSPKLGFYITDSYESMNIPLTPIKNLTITDNRLVDCFFFFDIRDAGNYNHRIVGNTINGKLYGYFTGNRSVAINGTPYASLMIANCEDITLEEGNFSDAMFGIELAYCNGCTIRDISITNSSIGILAHNSNMCTITSTHLSKNTFDWYNFAILTKSGVGLYLMRSSNFTIKFNDIHNNNLGVFFEASNSCLIMNNLIYNNTETGIFLDENCTGNWIYYNQIGWNGRNAVAMTSNNHWDDGVSHGNYWSDYDGEGVYNIYTSGVDHYPIVLTELVPFITTGIPVDPVVIGITIAGIAGVVVVLAILRKRSGA